jgi:hypothetical protein
VTKPAPIELHEVALAALSTVTLLALLIRSPPSYSCVLQITAGTILYTVVILWSHGRGGSLNHKIRFLGSYAFIIWFYLAVGRITPALGTHLRDKTLLTFDKLVFTQTPAIFFERFATARLTDVMSVCYMTYHLYLTAAVLHAMLLPEARARRLSNYLFTGFAIGFMGYLLVPAIGPGRAYAELFQWPLPGGALSRLVADIVAKGSSTYDVFPSLHVLIMAILLDYDWREVRRRFWIMLIPSVGLLISTIYLRYHYGVDVLVAILLFFTLRQSFLYAAKRQVRLPE